METESTKLDVHIDVAATSQDPSLGFLSTVIITLDREYLKDDSIKSLGSYPDSSSIDSPIILKIPPSVPEYGYSDLYSELRDYVLTKHILDEIVKAQLRIQSVDHLPPQQPLFMEVSVKLTHKVYNVVPCSSAPLATDLETCLICLKDLSMRSDECYQLPDCSHCFHEECVDEWVIRQNYYCPVCRRPIYEQSE
ncbi:Zinc finger RING-type [Arabidopsis suecica]|uniref:Zinc finger RING-type n=1 Tax=Arabidopsis suecica TaxID=45249 RepID=A0A8T2AEN2_ARASU|nr:Zinc finger RING-type [Arabidopsis suecica]